MLNVKNEDYKELMVDLYVDRMKNEGLSSRKRFEKDKAIVTAVLVGKRLISVYDTQIINDIAIDFSYMEALESIGKTVQDLIQDTNLDNLAKFAREDGLNDLFLAKKQIEKLIEVIEKSNPNYINFYKDSEV